MACPFDYLLEKKIVNGRYCEGIYIAEITYDRSVPKISIVHYRYSDDGWEVGIGTDVIEVANIANVPRGFRGGRAVIYIKWNGTGYLAKFISSFDGDLPEFVYN